MSRLPEHMFLREVLTDMKLAAAAVLSLVFVAVPVFAQTADTPPAPPAGVQDHRGPGMHHGPWMGHHMPMATRVAPVTNAPFSAKYTLESVQQAPGPDGLVQKYTATQTVYRDSLGRTREDVTMPVPPPRPLKQNADGTPIPPATGPVAPRTMTIIADPVANTITRLMPDKKTAMVEAVPAEFFKHATAREANQAAGDTARHGGSGAATDLGSRTFAGVVASGKRTTMTMPMRGDRPAPGTTTAETPANSTATAKTMTHETWFSPDLKLEVSSTETGERGTRSDVLTSLTKGEPDASLFKVPEGYTVKNAPPHMPSGMHRDGPGGPGGPGGPDAPAPPPAM